MHYIITLTLIEPWPRQTLLSRIAALHPATHFNLTALTPPSRDLALHQSWPEFPFFRLLPPGLDPPSGGLSALTT
jgi:hypothetical protein